MGSTPASPTYQDVIERSQKFTKNLRDEFLDCHHSYNDELAELEEQRKKVDRKFRSLLAKVSKNPHELRLRTQALVQELVLPEHPFSCSLYNTYDSRKMKLLSGTLTPFVLFQLLDGENLFQGEDHETKECSRPAWEGTFSK
uniref:Uncharacterized protein n=1 Tax=Sphaerodactylus townsendi TaxID=933632 RepID=A0ACB8E5R4_9SAUR